LVFGCSTTGGRCSWLDNGAVPRSVDDVSDCPADDICSGPSSPPTTTALTFDVTFSDGAHLVGAGTVDAVVPRPTE
jgi:hypothetical protein